MTGESLLLAALEDVESGAICIYGLPGAGKSMALVHLWASLPKGSMVTLLDDPTESELQALPGVALDHGRVDPGRVDPRPSDGDSSTA